MVYDRQPPITVGAEGATGAITYAAQGLPPGISYGASSGELSGTPTKIGEYPIVCAELCGLLSTGRSLLANAAYPRCSVRRAMVPSAPVPDRFPIGPMMRDGKVPPR